MEISSLLNAEGRIHIIFNEGFWGKNVRVYEQVEWKMIIVLVASKEIVFRLIII